MHKLWRILHSIAAGRHVDSVIETQERNKTTLICDMASTIDGKIDGSALQKIFTL
jgi:hypothetical protein